MLRNRWSPCVGFTGRLPPEDAKYLGNLALGGNKQDPLNNLTIPLDGNLIVASNQKTIYLFRDNEPNPYASFDVPIDIYKGHWIYSSYSTCGHGPSGGGIVVQNYALSPDHQYLAVDDGQDGFQMRRTSDGALLKSIADANVTYHVERFIRTILYHPYLPIITVSYSDGQIDIFNSESLQVAGVITGHTDFTSLSLSPVRPDGSVYLASGAADNFIRIWSLPGGNRVSTLEGSAESVTFSPDGNFLAYGSRNWMVDLFRLADGKGYPPQSGHLDYVEGLAFSPDSKTLVSSSPDCTLKIWQVNDDGLSLQLTLVDRDGHTDYLYDVAYSPDGTWVAVNGRFTLYFYNTHTKELRDLGEMTRSVSISPDSRYFAVTLYSGDEYVLRVYELSTMKQLKEWRLSTQIVTYSPDGKLFALGTDEGKILLADAYSGEVLLTLSGAAIPTEGSYAAVTHLQFSPDGRFLASVSNGVIRVWGVPKE